MFVVAFLKSHKIKIQGDWAPKNLTIQEFQITTYSKPASLAIVNGYKGACL